jgi:hypothetical protein
MTWKKRANDAITGTMTTTIETTIAANNR